MNQELKIKEVEKKVIKKSESKKLITQTNDVINE